MSAIARDREPNEEPLRPTRELALRPTREPTAPFVAGPSMPRVAPAPRVHGLRAATVAAAAAAETSEDQRRVEEHHGATAPVTAPAVVERFLIAAFSRKRVANALLVLRSKGFAVTPMLRAAAGPAGLSRELSRALRRATIAATVLGALGALVGALLVPSEALVPTLGWIPGPAVGAALLAGLLGAIGFAVGLLAVLVTPPRVLAPLLDGDEALLAVHAAESVDTIAAAVVDAGGTVVAH